jgi:hydroxyquinol 1,2-dioxygenase
MRNLDETTITQEVLARNVGTRDRRLHQIITGLVQHLHAFAREVQLTEQEWEKGIEFLTSVGQICSPVRQEFILLSDILGLSTLVIAQNHRKPDGCTEATVFGPFHVADAPFIELGADLSKSLPGTPWFVRGTVRGLNGEVVPHAVLEVWQADDQGYYDVQKPDLDAYEGRGILKADAQGHFHFRTIIPEAYPIPHDGPVGKLLEALERHPWRPAHLHFMVSAEGYERLVTHVFKEGGEYLDSDTVFGVRTSLIAEWVKHEAGIAPDGTQCDEPFCTLDFDFVLKPSEPN